MYPESAYSKLESETYFHVVLKIEFCIRASIIADSTCLL